MTPARAAAGRVLNYEEALLLVDGLGGFPIEVRKDNSLSPVGVARDKEELRELVVQAVNGSKTESATLLPPVERRAHAVHVAQ